MKKYIFVYLLLLVNVCQAQNVGIGTTTPGFPLNFSSTLGNKISLYGNSGPHYGFGVQGGLLQMYSDAPAANIGFGYGSSTSFTERMKLYNSGPDGLLLQGRMTLRNGTVPVNTDYGPGIWLARADNAANLGFMGTQNNQNIGFYGGPAGWGFTYDAVNSRVGIGNPNPNAPLSFPAAMGKKITLYPGTLGNVGMGVYANEFRLHSDYVNADITMGYENSAGVFTERMRVKGAGGIAFPAELGPKISLYPASYGNIGMSVYASEFRLHTNTASTDITMGYESNGIFTERMRVKANGGIAVNGSVGSINQVLTSNGTASPPAWTSLSSLVRIFANETNLILTDDNEITFSAGSPVISIVAERPSLVLLWYETETWQSCGVGACIAQWELKSFLNGNNIDVKVVDGISQTAASWLSSGTVGPSMFTINPGINTITFSAKKRVAQAFNNLSVKVKGKALIIPQ